jgi:hypothetical protein
VLSSAGNEQDDAAHQCDAAENGWKRNALIFFRVVPGKIDMPRERGESPDDCKLNGHGVAAKNSGLAARGRAGFKVCFSLYQIATSADCSAPATKGGNSNGRSNSADRRAQ